MKKKPAKSESTADRKKPDDPAQSQRFVETARTLDLDISGLTFERVLKSSVKNSAATDKAKN
jgi:hypothetical protein